MTMLGSTSLSMPDDDRRKCEPSRRSALVSQSLPERKEAAHSTQRCQRACSSALSPNRETEASESEESHSASEPGSPDLPSSLGTLRLEGISNTDGIASTQRPLPDYPLGLFAAIDDDAATAIVGWDVILEAIGWDFSRPNPHSSKNQRIAIEEIGGERHLTYSFPSLTGVTYSVNGSVDLIRFNQPLAEVLPASSGALPSLCEGLLYRTFRLIEPIKDQPKGFLRLDVNP